MNHEILHLLEIVKAVEGEDNADGKFILSAATPDRTNDTIDPACYDAACSPKTRKLIALWQHDKAQPIGYWSDLERVGDTLQAKLHLAQVPMGYMVKQMLADGVPLGASIGFRGKGVPNKKGGYHFTEMDLMETSIVSTPAHKRAQQIAKQFGIDLSTDVDGALEEAEARRRAVVALGKSALTLTKRS